MKKIEVVPKVTLPRYYAVQYTGTNADEICAYGMNWSIIEKDGKQFLHIPALPNIIHIPFFNMTNFEITKGTYIVIDKEEDNLYPRAFCNSLEKLKCDYAIITNNADLPFNILSEA